MSVGETAASLARRCFDKLVAYAREFVLVATYAAICVGITVPVLAATGAAIYWGVDALGLQGTVRTVYVVAGVVVVMFEFAMLYRFAEGLGDAMLGPTRELKV